MYTGSAADSRAVLKSQARFCSTGCGAVCSTGFRVDISSGGLLCFRGTKGVPRKGV